MADANANPSVKFDASPRTYFSVQQVLAAKASIENGDIGELLTARAKAWESAAGEWAVDYVEGVSFPQNTKHAIARTHARTHASPPPRHNKTPRPIHRGLVARVALRAPCLSPCLSLRQGWRCDESKLPSASFTYDSAYDRNRGHDCGPVLADLSALHHPTRSRESPPPRARRATFSTYTPCMLGC